MSTLLEREDNHVSGKDKNGYAGEGGHSPLRKIIEHRREVDGSPKDTTIVIDVDDDNSKSAGDPSSSENFNDSRSSSHHVSDTKSTSNGYQEGGSHAYQAREGAFQNLEETGDGDKECQKDDPSNESNGRLTRTRRGPTKRRSPQINRSVRKTVPGEMVLRRLIDEATYEVEQDAYRGISYCLGMIRKEMEYGSNQQEKRSRKSKNEEGNHASQVDAEQNISRIGSSSNMRSPWDISCCPFPIHSYTSENSEDLSTISTAAITETKEERSEAEMMVKLVCNNRCPTMIQWTERAIDQTRRKVSGRKRKTQSNIDSNLDLLPARQALGQRPKGQNIRCKCDANPFCLATLGGAVTDAMIRNLADNTTAGTGSDDQSVSAKQDMPKNGSSINHTDAEDNDGDVEVVDPIGFHRPKTRDQLNAIRKSVKVDKDRVKSYLQKTLRSGSLLEGYLETIRRYHEELIFQNPVDEEKTNVNQLELSLPPGIQNLGATCYLNTQLQCLAQNLVFLEGIISWEPPSSKEKRNHMTSVLELFQSLLVSMYAGPMATIETLEFSDALGLDHYEQQDPNEFSRLFFDKIHEFFVQQRKAESGAQNVPPNDSGIVSSYDLTQLLPTLFQGVIRYETTCLQCKTVSTRKEEFMDLNLNTTKPTEKKQKGQQSISDALAGAADIDVQFCLNRYCHDETLTDDNQYLCNTCNAKRDANRRLCFQKLPPVLNIQLSRYIFDLTSFTKKKLMDKVLLPRSISVPQMEGGNTPILEKRFVLCAVMKHLGKSAHSGHYIAEAMDWITGEWFEFNDEKVSLLGDGPSNSFFPECGEGNQAKGRKLPQGSQDAYNLYYVEEEFLAQSVYEFMQRRKKDSLDLPHILNCVRIERAEVFANLTQLCLDDRLVYTQLSRRRKLIIETMFSSDKMSENYSRGFVWVDGDFLRRFLSCEKTLTEELSNESSRCFVDDLAYECPHHGGLEPRLARKGKLLPQSMFDSMMEILKDEGGGKLSCMKMSNEVVCEKCDGSFKAELAHTLDRLRKVISLYEKFDPKEDEILLLHDEHISDNYPDSSHLFLVSKKFITAFRGEVVKMMKIAGTADVTASVETGSFPGEGLDSLNLELFYDDSHYEDFDFLVNSKITCCHGNLLNSIPKRTIRHVSSRQWATLKSIFPKAIEHKISRRMSESSFEARFYAGCSECESNDLVADTMWGTLSVLAKSFFNQPRSKVSTVEDILRNGDSQAYRLVHNDNLTALKRFCSFFKRASGKISAESIRSKLEEIFLPDKTHEFGMRPVPEHEVDLIYANQLGDFFPPLICKAHSLPIKAAVVDETQITRTVLPLNKNLRVLDEKTYEEFLAQLAAAAVLLIKVAREDLKLDDLDFGTDDIMKDAYDLCSACTVNQCHPVVFLADLCRTEESLLIHVESETVSTFLKPKDSACCDEDCNSQMKAWMEAKEHLERFNGKTVPPGKLDCTVNKPITIDCCDDDDDDAKNTTARQNQIRPLHVVEVEEAAENERIIECLAQVSGMPSIEACENPSVRRSGRRRKPRIPIGIVQSEEIVRFDFSRNLASLRLLLMQNCQQGAPFSLRHLIRLVIWKKQNCASDIADVVDVDKDATNESLYPTIFDLPFSLNEKSLAEISDKAHPTMSKLTEEENSIFLVRCASPDATATDIPEDSLTDHLTSLLSDSREKQTGKRKKPSMEKGFTGTFLSSSNNYGSATSPAKSSVNAFSHKTAMKDDGVCSRDGSTNTQKKARFARDIEIIPKNELRNGGSEVFCQHIEILDDDDEVLFNNDGASNAIKEVEKTSDENRLVGLAKAAELSHSSSLSEISTGSPKTTILSKEGSTRVVEVVDKLLQLPTIHSKYFCEAAASWAVQNNPNETEMSILVDSAVAKYYEFSPNEE